MGILRGGSDETIETSCRPYGPAEDLDMHCPRFGGPEMSDVLLEGLQVSGDDRIVEIWPGYGCTTRKVLPLRPRSYRGVAYDHRAARRLDGELRRGPDLRTLATGLEAEGVYTGFFAAPADATGLPDRSANVVFGESLLTALNPDDKVSVVEEATRLLRPGGRFGIHELCLIPNPSWNDTADAERAQALCSELGSGAGSQLQPLREDEWHAVVEKAGLVVTATRTGPLEVPTLRTLMRDVGPVEFARGLMGRLLHWEAMRSMRELSYVLARNSAALGSIALVAERPLIGDLLLPSD